MAEIIREGNPRRNPGLKLIAGMVRLLARDLPKFAVASGELDDVVKELDGIAQRLETTADLRGDDEE